MSSIASVSWGKDSTAMLLLLLSNNIPLDEVVFFNTGKEFEEVYQVRDKILPILKKRNIKYTELTIDNSFDYYMFEHKHMTRKGDIKYGYGWCGGLCRWCTTKKLQALDKYTKNYDIVYIGISLDEKQRVIKFNNPNKKAPLVDLLYSEIDCLQLCYDNGLFFGGLYQHLDRLSCWCCRNKNLKELTALKKYYPQYFNRLLEIEERLQEPMKKPLYLKDRNFSKDRYYQLKMF